MAVPRAAIKNFVKYFEIYIEMCADYNWPKASTSREDIRMMLEVAHHLEYSIHKMKFVYNCYDSVVNALHGKAIRSQKFIINCLKDPPKTIMKRVICSDEKLELIEYAFDSFQTIFSEERLVEVLSALFRQEQSKDTLLKNMHTVLTGDQVKEVKSHLFIFTLVEGQEHGGRQVVKDLLLQSSQDDMITAVLFLLNDFKVEDKRNKTLLRKSLITALIDLMTVRRNRINRIFWAQLFSVDKDNLVKLFLHYKNLRNLMFNAMIVNCVRIKNNERCCYAKHHMESQCKKFFANETLNFQFKEFVKANHAETHIESFFKY